MELFKLPQLPYSFDALEPYLDGRTMEIHYTKHHQTYTNNLNGLVKGHESFFKGKSIEEILSNLNEIPEDIRQGVINQGGGYANHNLYWSILTPNGEKEPKGELATKIKETFGSFDTFKKQLSQTSISQFGSGWGWLVLNANKQLEIIKTANQDSPLSIEKTPLLVIDVWEHAYYLKYQNRRPEFVDAIWNVINWSQVEKIYEQALNK